MMTAFMYGLYAAIASIVVTLIEYFTGLDRVPAGRYFGFLGVVALVAAIYLAIRERDQEEFHGFMTFGQGFGTGAMVGLGSSILTAIFMYIYLTYINIDFVDFIVEQSRQQMQAAHMPQNQIEVALKYTRMFTSPGIQALVSFVGGPIIGLLISLVVLVRYTGYIAAAIFLIIAVLDFTKGLPVGGVIFLIVAGLLVFAELRSADWRIPIGREQPVI